jgi:osmotically-inducible protein OsmY
MKKLEEMKLAMKLMMAAVVFSLTLPGMAQKPDLRIGTVWDGPWDRDQQIRAIFEEQITKALGTTHDVYFPSEKRLRGDWTRKGVRGAVDRLMADPEVDYILAMGMLSSAEVGTRPYLPKPVIAARMVAPELLHIPEKIVEGQRVSGVQNLSYVTVVGVDIRQAVGMFRDLVDAQQVTFLVMDALRQIFPDLERTVKELLKGMDLKIAWVYVRDDLGEVYKQLPSETEAVILSAMPHLEPGDFGQMMVYLRARKLPTFTLGPREDVEAGVMLGINSTHEIALVAERVASNLRRMVDGEEAGTLPVTLGLEEALTVNNATAAAIGFDVQAAVQRQAEVAQQRATTASPSMAGVASDQAQPDLRRAGPQLTEKELQERQTRIIQRVQSTIARLSTYSVFDSLSFRVEGASRVVLMGYCYLPTVKSEAERSVQRIEEVEEVVNLIEILPNSPADDDIRIRTYANIYGHPSMRRYVPGGGFSSVDVQQLISDLRIGLEASSLIRGPHAIHILVKNGNVALVGAVASELHKQIAEVQANTVPGAFSVENHLQVVQ